jgi:dipeptidyl aminopeptidase/acylaminoacyl peptidase
VTPTQAARRSAVDTDGIKRASRFDPRWLADGDRFVVALWTGSGSRLVLVDPVASSTTTIAELADDVDDIEVRGGDRVLVLSGGAWLECAAGGEPRPAESAEVSELLDRRARAEEHHPGETTVEVAAPSGTRFLVARDHDLWIRTAGSDRLDRLTDDGEDRLPWSDGRWTWPASSWSPDGATIAAWKIDSRASYHMPVVDWIDSSEAVSHHLYTRSGDPLPAMRLHLIDVETGERTVVADDEDTYLRSVGWRPDGSEFLFLALSRDGRRLELRAVDRATARVRVVMTDVSDTFVTATVRYFEGDPDVRILADGTCLVSSERSGWRHLFAVDPAGAVRSVTEGEFPVLEIAHVDEEAGEVHVLARPDPERRYDRHLLAVPLGGGAPRRLTETTGDHAVQFAPSGRFYIDTHSAVDRAPVTEVRRRDGARVLVLEHPGVAAISADVRPPEEFVATASDGATPLHGVLYLPRDFDPAARYPVVELIYGGPHLEYVPHSFVQANGEASREKLRDLGFAVVIVDARGTRGRSKAFLDAACRLGTYEIADHAAALRELAGSRPYLDLDRVAIVGGSFGGYFATRAMLQAPDLYSVGVASCPVAEFETSMIFVTEIHLGGRPDEIPEAYRSASNLVLADRLRGPLLIAHGTSDINAPLGQTMKLLDAFQRAGKSVDLVLYPGGDHGYRTGNGASGIDGWPRILDYLVEHLHPGIG